MKTGVLNAMVEGIWAKSSNFNNYHPHKWGRSISTRLILWSFSYFLLFNPIVLAASNVLKFYKPGLLGIISFILLGLVILSYAVRMVVPGSWINLANALFAIYLVANLISFAFSSMQTTSVLQMGIFIAYSIIPWGIGFLGAQYGVNITRYQGLAALILIVITLFMENVLFGRFMFRPGELIGNPLSIATSGALATLLFAQSSRKPWAMHIEVIAIGSILVFLTGTRRAVLGIMVALIIHVIARGRFFISNKWWRYVILVAIAAIFPVIISQWKITSLRRWTYTLNMLYIGTIWDPRRAELASRALEAFTSHPFIGNWDYVTRGNYAHNMYLDILGRTGLTGLAPFILLSGWIALRAWKLRRTEYHVWLLFYVLVMTSGVMTSTVFDDPVFWSIAGYLTGVSSKRTIESSRPFGNIFSNSLKR